MAIIIDWDCDFDPLTYSCQPKYSFRRYLLFISSLLYGLPAYQLNKLQMVQNAATRLIFLESKYCHVRPLLYNLHWLPVKLRIDFKILLLTYIIKAINSLGTGHYLAGGGEVEGY